MNMPCLHNDMTGLTVKAAGMAADGLTADSYKLFL